MASVQDPATENPNIRRQYYDWREQRAQRGEDPTDWSAFRDHVMAIGAPDPGADEADDFVGGEFKTAHPERYGSG